MNTLRILKGADIKIYVDEQMLCFVRNFCAEEKYDVYEIKEILSDEIVDTVNSKKSYMLTICSLSHLDDSVFTKDNFTVSVIDGTQKYEYLNCQLKSKQRDVQGNTPVVMKYVITASQMQLCEV